MGPLGTDQFGGVQQVLGRRRPDDRHRPLEGEGRVDDAQAGRRDAEAGGRLGDAQVAGDGDLGAAAHARALDEGDGRAGERGQGVVSGLVHGVVGGAVGEAAELGDVGAGAEVLAGAAHHEDPHGGVVGQLGAGAGDARPHGLGDRVALVGAVEPQRGHRAVAGDHEGLVGGGEGRVAHGPILAQNPPSHRLLVVGLVLALLPLWPSNPPDPRGPRSPGRRGPAAPARRRARPRRRLRRPRNGPPRSRARPSAAMAPTSPASPSSPSASSPGSASTATSWAPPAASCRTAPVLSSASSAG